MNDDVRVSVVIPTYRDWGRLRQCLGALSKQTMPASRVEIIVVDNDDDPLPLADRPPGVRYVHEPEGFSYAARNAGLAAATGAIIAFTDSDCLPEPGWIQAGVEATRTLDLAGGAISMFFERDSVAARYDYAFGLRQAEYFRTWCTFVTANLFVRREAFEKLGSFNGALESGGDFEFCLRAGAAGLSLGFVPEAVVRHPARADLAELIRKTRRTARGVVEFRLRRHRSRADAWRSALRQLRPRLIDWAAALAGGRGSEVLPFRQRPAVLCVKMLLHYVFVFEMIAALRRSIRERGWP